MNSSKIYELKQREQVSQTELQDAVPEVFETCSALLLEWTTGVGKGRAIMKTCERFENVLLTVDKLNQIETFKQDCIKHGFSYDQYTFTHRNSLKKYKGIKYDCIVLNEADSISDNAMLVLSELQYDKLLLAAAKFPLPKKVQFWNTVCKFDTWYIDLTQANKWGILPVPEIQVHYVEPSTIQRFRFNVTKSKNYETLYANSYETFISTLGLNKNLFVDVTEKDALQCITHLVEYYRDEAREKGWGTKGNPSFPAMNCFRYGSLRKNLLSKIKLDKMKQLHSEINQRKVIFVNSIDDCFTEYYIYSKNGKKINDENLRKFNEGEINEITAIQMLNRDMNLVDCPVALVGSIGSNPVELTQRIGRALRHSNPVIYIPLVKGEKDDILFKKQVKNYIVYE